MRKRTNIEYVNLLKIDNKFQALEPYIGSTKKILHECLKCNYKWEVRPQQLLAKNSGCPKCTSWKNSVTKVDQTLATANIQRLSEYLGTLKPIKLKHNTCGYEWVTKYSYIQQGSGCPNCNKGYGYKTKDKVPEKATLYLLDIITYDSEHFLKVGITSQPINRRLSSIASQIGDDLVKISCIYLLQGPGKLILELEQSIHNNSDIMRFSTKHKFDGRTELKLFEYKDQIINYLEGLRTNDTIRIK